MRGRMQARAVARMERRMGRIIAAIPAFNEEVAIGSVVLKAKKHSDEVVVIDDGSGDATAEIAAAAGAKVIKHPRNLGKGAAIRTALEYAKKDGIDILVLHDGDMQHDPEEIPMVVQPILDGRADVAIGTRKGKWHGMPLHRRMGRRVLDRATSLAMGKHFLTDSQNGFRAFSRIAVNILKPSGDGIGVESEMLVKALDQGLRVVEVPVSVRYGVDGSTYHPAKHGIQVLGTIITLISEMRPLFFFGVSGFVMVMVAALLAAYTTQIYLSTRIFAIGYALLFLLFAILGVLSIFVGIVLNSINRIIRKLIADLTIRENALGKALSTEDSVKGKESNQQGPIPVHSPDAFAPRASQ